MGVQRQGQILCNVPELLLQNTHKEKEGECEMKKKIIILKKGERCIVKSVQGCECIINCNSHGTLMVKEKHEGCKSQL